MKFPLPPATMNNAQFVSTFGGVYEHSPWIAEQAWAGGLTSTHNQLEGLATLMADIVEAAPAGKQLELIRTHPDLAGKAAQAGELTAESSGEQSAAGIHLCSAEEFEKFQTYNQRYTEKFKFPFIMAVKGANRYQILSAFEQRLPNHYQCEFNQALQQIHKIARFRLEYIAQSTAAGTTT